MTAGLPATVAAIGGASADPVERLLEAIVTADAGRARRIAAADPGLVGRLQPDDRATLVTAAEHGNLAAVAVMLELGFPIDVRRDGSDEDGATALHAASWAGSADTVALLIDRGADLGARDTRWHAQPLHWALVGSGEAPANAPNPDWVATVRILIDAGAPVEEIALDPDDPKRPSPAVRDLLRARGLIGAGHAG